MTLCLDYDTLTASMHIKMLSSRQDYKDHSEVPKREAAVLGFYGDSSFLGSEKFILRLYMVHGGPVAKGFND